RSAGPAMNNVDNISERCAATATASRLLKSTHNAALLVSVGATAILLAAASPATAASSDANWSMTNFLALGPIVNRDELGSDAGRGVDPTTNGTVANAIQLAALGIDPPREQLAELQAGASFQSPSAIQYLCRDKLYSDSGAVQNQHAYAECDPGAGNGGVI